MVNKRIFSDKKYIENLYDSVKRPIGAYPAKLAKHLVSRYYQTLDGGSLLDVGCGRGDMLKEFAAQGLQTFGLDLSPASQDLCKPHEVRVADLEIDAFPYEADTFDFIFSK